MDVADGNVNYNLPLKKRLKFRHCHWGLIMWNYPNLQWNLGM